MTASGYVERLKREADEARGETIQAHLALGAADRRYRTAMANQAAASKRLLDARTGRRS